LLPDCSWVDDTVKYPTEFVPPTTAPNGAVPNTTPDVVSVNVTLPVGLIPPLSPGTVTESVTFCPG